MNSEMAYCEFFILFFHSEIASTISLLGYFHLIARRNRDGIIVYVAVVDLKVPNL